MAIVGPTGAGKTTIINQIPRFCDVAGGAIRIDGLDVHDVTRASLCQQIGIVLQDTFRNAGQVLVLMDGQIVEPATSTPKRLA